MMICFILLVNKTSQHICLDVVLHVWLKYVVYTSAVVSPTVVSLITSLRKFSYLGTNSRSLLVRKIPVSCQNYLVLPSRTFSNKSFIRGSCWRHSLISVTRSDFGWFMLSMDNSFMPLSAFTTTLAFLDLYSSL